MITRMILVRRCLIIMITMVTMLHVNATTENTECEEDEECMDAEMCPVYISFKKLPKSEQAAQIPRLRSKVCNKKPHRLCCAVETINEDPKSRELGNGISFSSSFLPNKTQCGVSSGGSKSVVFGQNAILGEYPWAALLGSEKVIPQWVEGRRMFVPTTFTLYHCGGTLINTWYILTAAHCHVGDNKIITVVLGEWDVLTDPDCAEGDVHCDNPRVQKHDVTTVIVHHGYDKSNHANDIALVKTKEEVTLNIFVQLACLPLLRYNLPTLFHNPELQTATVIGWGQGQNKADSEIKMEHGVDQPKLQKGQIPIQPLSMCEEAFSNYNISPNQLCAGGGDRHTDSCKGDSGGGLFVHSNDFPGQSVGNVHFLVGVTSMGALGPCGDLPSVYTKVDQYTEWIQDNLV